MFYVYPDREYAEHLYQRDHVEGETFFKFTTDLAREHEKAGNTDLAQAWRERRWEHLASDIDRSGGYLEALWLTQRDALSTTATERVAVAAVGEVRATDAASTAGALNPEPTGRLPAAGDPRVITTIQKGALSTMDETRNANGRAQQQPTDAPETLPGAAIQQASCDTMSQQGPAAADFVEAVEVTLGAAPTGGESLCDDNSPLAGGGDAIERARCAVEQVTLARAQHQATRRRSGDHVRAQIADRGVYDLELWDSGGVIDQPFSGL